MSEIKVFLRCYDDRGDPYPPNNWRPEIMIGRHYFLPDFREYPGNNSCMTKEQATKVAEEVAGLLGVQVGM